MTLQAPIAIVKLSPAVTGLAVIVPENRKLPAVEASHAEKNAYVSEVETLVHATAAVFEIVPEDAAVPKVACWRVVLPAAPVVPAAPGDAVWSLTQTAVGCVHVVLRQSAFKTAFATVEDRPTAI